ncbi:MAG: carboxypeptidase-like regulatory domain-containing protein, partial [Bacteroidales bacterium]|nr:carboxypeptidase-like regulatory domain-containing protein [Bacteroidales bacterium]
MRKLLLTSLIICTLVFSAFGQQKTVTGTITDQSDGLPVIGATVLVKGTSVGTATGLDGKFTISADPGSTLVFRFVGMKSQEILVGDRTVIDVTLELDDVGLDEVIVVGYGSAIKRELTGAITKVETKGIAEVPVASFESAIQGKTSGVFIEQASGKLGETVKMRIRGSSSVSANNQPLYVVDGVPITAENLSNSGNQPTSPLADLAMTDVES